jgi:ubiquinone/menaquinone biosynthesis C-methylase UbiE
MAGKVSYRQYSDSAARNYERYFVPTIAAPVAGDLLEAAQLQPGERVLDVACGTGVVARLAAARVGDDGRVVGTDVAPDMIDVARSTPQPPGAEIEWQVAEAGALPFPDGDFDVVLCQMGLPFFPDRAMALQEMRRVLAEGGRLVINTPGNIQRPFEIMEEALVHQISPELGGFVGLVFSIDDPDEVARMLDDAGFSDVDARTSPVTLHFPPPAEFLWQYINLTPMGAFVNPAPEEAKAALEREVVDGWQEFLEDDGSMVGEQPMVLATGRA